MAKYVNMRLSDVRVPPEFRAHPPADAKIETRRIEYQAKQKFARNIAVTSAGIRQGPAPVPSGTAVHVAVQPWGP